MFKNIKQKLYQEYDKSINAVSQVTTDYIIKKDFYSNAKKHKKDIHSALEYFLTTYIKIIGYLKDDFNVISLKYSNPLYNIKNKEEIEDELKSMNGIYKHYIKKKFFNREFTKGISIIPFTGTIEKWNILNHFFNVFPELLTILKNKANSNIYKDVNIKEINEKLKEYIFLKEDFSYIMKQVKKDKEKKYGN